LVENTTPQVLFQNRIVPVLAEIKNCSPRCELFRCGKHAVVLHGNNAWCRWAEEECNIANCSYATCTKRRLLPNGICGETVKRKTVERKPEEEIVPTVKLRGKAFRKIGEKEIF